MSATVVLLHGGAHGAWCFDRLIPRLEARGLVCRAPDIGFSSPGLSLVDHAVRIVEAVERSDDLVLVAHSMAGLIAPLVAARRPVRRLILLCAVVPEAGRSVADLTADPGVLGPSIVPEPALAQDASGLRYFVSADWLAKYLYQDCDPATVAWAWDRLSKIDPAIMIEPCPMARWPEVPTASIVATDDRAVNPVWSRAAAERVGADVVELKGSSHSPFASRPAELAGVIADLVRS